jgi:hypothetical protein
MKFFKVVVQGKRIRTDPLIERFWVSARSITHIAVKERRDAALREDPTPIASMTTSKHDVLLDDKELERLKQDYARLAQDEMPAKFASRRGKSSAPKKT